MKKRKFVGMFSLVLVGMVFTLILTACGGTAKPSDSSHSDVGDGSRIEELVQKWSEAGISANLKEKTSSNTLNSLYGCINQYIVSLDGAQFMVLEYDINNLSSTASDYLQFVDKNGYDSKTSDPAWHSGEFVLKNAFSVIDAGEVVAEYSIQDHPKGTLIIDTFKAFK